MEWQDNMKWEAEDVYLNGKSDFFRAYQGEDLLWEDTNSVSSERYLVIECTYGTVYVTYKSDGTYSPSFEYSYDGVNFKWWVKEEISNASGLYAEYETIDIKEGEKLYIRRVYTYGYDKEDYPSKVSDLDNHFDIHASPQDFYKGKCKIYGNLKALTNIDIPYLEYSMEFDYLFANSDAYMDCSKLVLPYGSKRAAFRGMFLDCINLTKAPVIPKMDMNLSDAMYMYQWMFKRCWILEEITCLTYAPSTDACLGWLWGAGSSNTTFIKRKGVNWTHSESGIPLDFNIIEK